ncbi:siderophore-interacting protein, partial [Microbacterium sp.]|uniref:siderophore-interacting protein n=1 Tax=Microbacterium sp. TaxID=51671 RepID=UPI003C76AEED
MPANPRLFGGGYRDVLDNPQHTAGLDRGSLRITGIHPVGDTLTRVVARLDHPMDAAVWRVANATIRLEIPGLDEGEIVSRVYTVREVRDAADGVEVVVDFVRHAHVSPVLRWLDAAAIGDTVPIIGPRQHFLPAFLPGRAVALFADETAIPALASILRDWHEGYEGTVWIEARDAALVDELSAPAGVTLHWLAAGAPGALV